MTPEDDVEGSASHRAWSLVLGIGWLIAIAVTIYLTRHLDPRSWVPSVDGFHLPDLPGPLHWLFGPWKFVVIAVVVGLVTEIRRRRRSPGAADLDAPPSGEPPPGPEPPNEE